MDVTYVPSGRDGIVAPEAIEQALTPETTLVSVMLANNGIGTIQPVAEIARLVKARVAELGGSIVLHTDAVQGPGALERKAARDAITGRNYETRWERALS